MFDARPWRPELQEELWPVRRAQTDRCFQLATQGDRTTGQHCRPCCAAYKREHYEANKQRYIDQAAASQRKLRLEQTILLIEFFKEHPCADCGERDPVVLEFDHLRDKLFDISHSLPYRNWQSILNEIAKCDVVCANCYRRRTAQRRGALRAVLTQA